MFEGITHTPIPRDALDRGLRSLARSLERTKYQGYDVTISPRDTA